MSDDVTAELIELLRLERIEDNLFRGASRDIGTRYVFGGQVLGQALSAAQQTVDTAILRDGGPDTGSAVRVLGPTVDDQTRCIHYSSPLDIVAIRFPCCDAYYPCHDCHTETADHPAEVWAAADRDTDAVLCGACGSHLTIDSYADVDACPACGAGFNPGCRLHSHLYFARVD